uniref:Uncharacterized protein n=1 Tax=Anopheles albimanus TaxID=7167 RepID=A0A182FVR9_ANOAL
MASYEPINNINQLPDKLHTLYLKSYASSFVYPYNVAPIVRSNSLRHLTVDKVFPVTADMPALATYEGPLSALHRLGPNMPRNQFEMMHKLSITDKKFECSGGFFGESCLLDMNTPMYRLRKIRFNSCQLDSKHLKGLHEKLPKLKELEFENCQLKSGDRLDDECQRF